MSKEEVKQPGKEKAVGSYSAGIKSGGFLFVSGCGPVDIVTGKVIEGTIEEQTKITLGYIDSILTAGGCTSDDVVKSTVHLLDIDDFADFDKVYAAYFANQPRPARTTVQSVLWGDIKVEIDVIAKLPD
jgi:2-iminobutanoate/2-iminopropanoate deaminase